MRPCKQKRIRIQIGRRLRQVARTKGGVAAPILVHNGEACQLKQYRRSRETVSELHPRQGGCQGDGGGERQRSTEGGMLSLFAMLLRANPSRKTTAARATAAPRIKYDDINAARLIRISAVEIIPRSVEKFPSCFAPRRSVRGITHVTITSPAILSRSRLTLRNRESRVKGTGLPRAHAESWPSRYHGALKVSHL